MSERPRQVLIYSDVSQRFGVMAYCACVIVDSRKPSYHTGILKGVGTSTTAECAASDIGLRLAPVADVAVVYSDLTTLIDIMDGTPVSYLPTHDGLEEQIAAVRESAARFGLVKYRLVSRGNGYYRACHSRARKAAGSQHV